MKTGVNIQFTNTRTGVASSADGVALLMVHAVAVGSTFKLKTLYTLTQLSDLAALGITETYDETNTSSLYRQVSEFYSAAGAGARLYLLGIDKETAMSSFVATDEFRSLLRSTGVSAEGNPSPATRARMIGVVFSPQDTPTAEGSFYADVLPTATALETALNRLWDEGFRAFAILDGNNLKSVKDAPDASTQGCTRVAISITTATKDSCASVGLPLGILARQTVQYELSNVSAGALPVQGAWFTDGTPVASQLPSAFDTLGMSQYLFMRTRDTKSGFYFNDGATASDPTMALSTIAANRVLNKIADYAQAYLTDVIGQTPSLDNDGNINAGYLSALEEGFISTYVNPMIADGEVSDVEIKITNEAPFSSTRTIEAAISILPRPGVARINANIKFVTSL